MNASFLLVVFWKKAMEILHIDPGKPRMLSVSELQGAKKVQSGLCTPRESG